MSTETSTTTTTTCIALTDVAAQKVSALLKQEGRDDLSLRVAVQPGGCSGLRYQLYFDDRALEGDTITEFGAEKVNLPEQKGNYRVTKRENDDTLNKLGWIPKDKLKNYIQSL